MATRFVLRSRSTRPLHSGQRLRGRRMRSRAPSICQLSTLSDRTLFNSTTLRSYSLCLCSLRRKESVVCSESCGSPAGLPQAVCKEDYLNEQGGVRFPAPHDPHYEEFVSWTNAEG